MNCDYAEGTFSPVISLVPQLCATIASTSHEPSKEDSVDLADDGQSLDSNVTQVVSPVDHSQVYPKEDANDFASGSSSIFNPKSAESQALFSDLSQLSLSVLGPVKKSRIQCVSAKGK